MGPEADRVPPHGGHRSIVAEAGLNAEASADVRHAVRRQRWGNMTTNPVSALAGAASVCILAHERVRSFMALAMDEAAAIGEHIGCPIERRRCDARDEHAGTTSR